MKIGMGIGFLAAKRRADVISSCVIRTAANSILTRVLLLAYTLAVAPASTFPATPTYASPVAVVLPSTSAKQGLH